jgi:hypothetical protein
MIKYRLACNEGHEFEGWFQSGAAFDAQSDQKLISCPHCGSAVVSKAIMAPSVAHQGSRDTELSSDTPPGEATLDTHELMRKLRQAVEARAEYVGPRFAEEARKIHFEESPARGIYGEASPDEARSLHEDGIPILPLPRLREDLN